MLARSLTGASDNDPYPPPAAATGPTTPMTLNQTCQSRALQRRRYRVSLAEIHMVLQIIAAPEYRAGVFAMVG
jgi:hypothetical protein